MEDERNAGILPREGSILYNLLKSDENTRKKTLKRFKKMNKYFTLPFYKIGLLPLLGFGRIFLILTTKGRITGKMRKRPLEYRKIDDIITIFSARGENSDWLKNLRANPESARVKHGFHSFKPRIEFVEDYEEKLRIIKYYIANYQKAAKMLFGWNPEKDDLDIIDLSTLTNLLSIIRLHRL
ncbi:MAG: nitroreductase family deazaflavin-dependent oxidoreductase [Promethearchaeota archaeon]